MNDLEHKVIVVTGGAGYLGTAIIDELLAHGAHVLCLGSRAPARKNHSSLAWDIVDCGNAGELAAALHAYPGIDGLVNLAGRALRGKNQRPDDFVKVLKDTVGVQYTVCKALAPQMWPKSSIVNVGSLWGRRAPDFSLYLDLNNEPSPGVAAGFGGVGALTRYLAVSYAPKVRVNAIIPGWFPKPGPNPRHDYIAGIENRTPLNRIGRPADLIGPVLFLLSSASAFITGQEIVVDGGFSIQ